GERSELTIYLSVKLFLRPPPGETIVFPFHRTTSRVRIPARRIQEFDLSLRTLGPTRGSGTPRGIAQSSTIDASDTEALVYGAGVLVLNAWTQTSYFKIAVERDVHARVTLQPAHSDWPLEVPLDLPPVEARQQGMVARWA